MCDALIPGLTTAMLSSATRSLNEEWYQGCTESGKFSLSAENTPHSGQEGLHISLCSSSCFLVLEQNPIICTFSKPKASDRGVRQDMDILLLTSATAKQNIRFVCFTPTREFLGGDLKNVQGHQ